MIRPFDNPMRIRGIQPTLRVHIVLLAYILSLLFSGWPIFASPDNTNSSHPQHDRRADLTELLPSFDNDPYRTICAITNADQILFFFVARKKDVFVGTAVESTSLHGYGGLIRLIIGINADNTIRQVKVIQQQESPGLGSKIGDYSFTSQFTGKSIVGTRWEVRCDDGDIDAITGATISSRAITEAIRRALGVYQQHHDAIAATTMK